MKVVTAEAFGLCLAETIATVKGRLEAMFGGVDSLDRHWIQELI